MKLEKWTVFAEVIGSAAIVVSLVVVIIELRANTEMARVTAFESASRDFSDNRRFYLSNPEVIDLAFAVNSGAFIEIDPESKEGLSTIFFLLNTLTGLERAYLSYQAGVFGEDEWARVQRSECATWGRIRETPYQSRVAFRLTDSYVAHLDSTCTPQVVEDLGNLYEERERNRP